MFVWVLGLGLEGGVHVRGVVGSPTSPPPLACYFVTLRMGGIFLYLTSPFLFGSCQVFLEGCAEEGELVGASSGLVYVHGS